MRTKYSTLGGTLVFEQNFLNRDAIKRDNNRMLEALTAHLSKIRSNELNVHVKTVEPCDERFNSLSKRTRRLKTIVTFSQ